MDFDIDREKIIVEMDICKNTLANLYDCLASKEVEIMELDERIKRLEGYVNGKR